MGVAGSLHRDREDQAVTDAARQDSGGDRLRTRESADGVGAGNATVSRLLEGDTGAPSVAMAVAAGAGNAAVARLVQGTGVRRAALRPQGAGPLDPQIGAAIDAERGGGAPLPGQVRADMEGHLNTDLGAVRVHTGPTAAALNRAVTAEAFTSGSDVFIGGGRGDLAGPAGRELLAHELTHVVQQAGGGGAQARVSHPDEPAEVEARAVARRVAQGSPAPPTASVPVAGLARSARSATVHRAPAKTAGGSRLGATVSTLEAVSGGARRNVSQLNGIASDCRASLDASSAHLEKVNDLYKDGHAAFMAALIAADQQHDHDEAVEGVVQGLLIAVALAVVLPEAIAAVAVLRVSAAAAEKALEKLGPAAAEGAKAAAGEAAEQATGAGVDQGVQGPATRPSDTAEGAGPSPGDRFEQAFRQLRKMISMTPDTSPHATIQSEVAVRAEKLIRRAEGLADGDAAGAAEIEQDAAALARLKTAGDDAIREAAPLAARLRAMKEQTVARPILTKDQVENQLWLAWMASLEGRAREVLDNDKIEEYLGPEGKNMFDPGANNVALDRQNVVKSARVRWLKENGVTPGDNPDTQYHVKIRLNEIEQTVVGQPGVVTSAGRGPGWADWGTVTVGGRRFHYAGNQGMLPVNTQVVVKGAEPLTPYLLDGSASLAQVRDIDFKLLCG
jgi:hypothetical protein